MLSVLLNYLVYGLFDGSGNVLLDRLTTVGSYSIFGSSRGGVRSGEGESRRSRDEASRRSDTVSATFQIRLATTAMKARAELKASRTNLEKMRVD